MALVSSLMAMPLAGLVAVICSLPPTIAARAVGAERGVDRVDDVGDVGDGREVEIERRRDQLAAAVDDGDAHSAGAGHRVGAGHGARAGQAVGGREAGAVVVDRVDLVAELRRELIDLRLQVGQGRVAHGDERRDLARS